MRDIIADLTPPLGYPGGSCHLIDRAVDGLGRRSEPLVKKVEEGEKFTKNMEQALYDDLLEGNVKGTGFKFVAITPHAQYRMDQRGVNGQEVRAALQDYWREYIKDPRRWEGDKNNSRLIPWVYRGVRVVFAWVKLRGIVGAQIITVVEEGVKDPGPMLRQECREWGGWSKVVPLPTPLERLKLANPVGHIVPQVRVDPEMALLDSARRVARRAELKMAPVPGVQTFVREDSAKGLPTNLDREDQVALPLPGSATPGGAGRDIPKFEYNTPDSESNIQPRTLGIPGEDYGHPTKYDYNMPTRRSMTARAVRAYSFNQVDNAVGAVKDLDMKPRAHIVVGRYLLHRTR